MGFVTVSMTLTEVQVLVHVVGICNKWEDYLTEVNLTGIGYAVILPSRLVSSSRTGMWLPHTSRKDNLLESGQF